MLELLHHPLKPGHAVISASLATMAVAVYCVAYTALAGAAESPAEAIGWGVVNVLPWLAAFELGKRVRGLLGTATVVFGCLAFSLSAGKLLEPEMNLIFELIRRVPALTAVGVLLIGGRLVRQRSSSSTPDH